MREKQTRLEREISKLREEYSKRQNTFLEIMKTAKRIEEENPDALKELVRVLGMKWQNKFLAQPYMQASSYLPFDPYEEWFSPGCGKEDRSLTLTRDGKDFYDLGKPAGQIRILSLSQDLVIPTRIQKDQFRKAVFCLEEGGCWSLNRHEHHGWVWEPAGIVMVEDQDSTITRGILQGQGEVEIRHVYDYSAVYKFVHCDGQHFIRTWDGKELAPVFDVALAAIFEIGRIILKGRRKGWNPFRRIKL